MQDVYEVLLSSELVNEEELIDSFNLFGDSDELWQNLVSKGLITEEQVFRALAAHRNLEYVDISSLNIENSAIAMLPPDFSRDNNVLSVQEREGYLFLATANPDDIIVRDEAGRITGLKVAPIVVAPSILQGVINRSIRTDREMGELSQELASETDDIEEEEADEFDEAPVVRLVNLFIHQAIRDRASDIHIEPRQNSLRIRYRIDGVLHTMQEEPTKSQAGILSRLKIMADLDIAERRKPQDGRMSISYQRKKIDIRVASLPTVWGEKIIMRILDHDTERKSLDGIGMSDYNLEVFRDALNQPHGMILATGPTGSGKSTTLYTSLDEVTDDSVNVITVEDPVEKRIEGVNQIQINNKAGLTFPTALKSILRSDPDILLVGEIRDEETATIAVEASLTGHLVLSTLHTNSAAAAPVRLVEMGVEPYLVSTAVSAVIAQRLARKLCSRCKEEYTPDAATYDSVNFSKDEDGNYPETIFQPVGCQSCSNTGYAGRVALMEIMRIDENIATMISSNAPASELQKEAAKSGFKTLREDGWRRVKDGETTIEEVLRVSS